MLESSRTIVLVVVSEVSSDEFPKPARALLSPRRLCVAQDPSDLQHTGLAMESSRLNLGLRVPRGQSADQLRCPSTSSSGLYQAQHCSDRDPLSSHVFSQSLRSAAFGKHFGCHEISGSAPWYTGSYSMRYCVSFSSHIAFAGHNLFLFLFARPCTGSIVLFLTDPLEGGGRARVSVGVRLVHLAVV